jgi:alpha-glucosidase
LTNRHDAPWWREGVLYQIYPRSFADSNGDGIGDLRGIAERLDYLAWLGIDGVWLNPITPSPDADWGYDVSDYCAVHPELGDLADLDALVAAADERDIHVLLDLVPNHTSDRHPWFEDARRGRDARHRDWYVWADPKPDGSAPNNWVSSFAGGAWTLDEASGQYYLHNFLPAQPDLNWWNEEVREAFDEILRFWFARGIAGFRIDVAHGIVKDRELRDNPPLRGDEPPELARFGQRHVYNINRPEVHDVFRRWRTVADAYEPARVLVGETWVMDLVAMAAFYGAGQDELDLAFNFPFVYAPFETSALRTVVEATESVLPSGAWPAWTGSNHDAGRFPSRWCGGREDKIRCALVVLLTLRGTPFLYYGDELGLTEADIRPGEARDPVGRDHSRTPMPWSPEPGGGFTAPGVESWLPLHGHEARSVASQRDDTASTLALCRDLIALRRRSADLRSGSYVSLPAPADVWAWRRGRGTTVALNLTGRDAAVAGVEGSIALCTVRERDGEPVRGRLALGPWQGAVVGSV